VEVLARRALFSLRQRQVLMALRDPVLRAMLTLLAVMISLLVSVMSVRQAMLVDLAIFLGMVAGMM
jgi:hypothetical protein